MTRLVASTSSEASSCLTPWVLELSVLEPSVRIGLQRKGVGWCGGARPNAAIVASRVLWG